MEPTTALTTASEMIQQPNSLMGVLSVVKWLSFVFFSMAALIHIGFFYLEAFALAKKPQLMKVNPQHFDTLRPWCVNQGYYNLFLAIGMIAGLICVLLQRREAAGALVGFCGLFMIGAGIVLRLTVPTLKRGFYLQTFPPLLGFLFLSVHIFSRIITSQ